MIAYLIPRLKNISNEKNYMQYGPIMNDGVNVHVQDNISVGFLCDKRVRQARCDKRMRQANTTRDCDKRGRSFAVTFLDSSPRS